MSNDIEVFHNGDLAPYSPGGDLAPITPADSWGIEPDYLSERPSVQPSPDVQLQAVYAEVGRVIASDMLKLGHPQAWVSATLNWYSQNIGRDPGRVQRKHRFNLHDQAGDALAEAFGNHCAKIGASQEYVSNVLWLLGEAAKRLTGAPQQVQQNAQSGTSASAILDSLDDKTYDYVVRHNENVKGQTEAYLRAKWRDSCSQNIATANQYLANLPESHRAYFDQFEPGTWTLSLNSATTVEGLFKMAIGGHNLPSGSALATEIAQIERLMREDRKTYNRDIQIQARYRTLLELRGY